MVPPVCGRVATGTDVVGARRDSPAVEYMITPGSSPTCRVSMSFSEPFSKLNRWYSLIGVPLLGRSVRPPFSPSFLSTPGNYV